MKNFTHKNSATSNWNTVTISSVLVLRVKGLTCVVLEHPALEVPMIAWKVGHYHM